MTENGDGPNSGMRNSILTDRRQFMSAVTKVGGTALAASSVQGVAAKPQQNKKKKIIQQARKIRSNAGPKAYHNFLEAKGINQDYKTLRLKLNTQKGEN